MPASRRPTRRHRTAVRQRRFERLEPRHVLSASSVLAIDADAGLRDALAAANSNGEDDHITLAAGLYELTAVGDGDLGDLNVTEAGTTLTITGAGAGVTVIDASTLGDRVFDVGPDATLVLVGVTVTGGDADEGGGLRNLGRLELRDSVVIGNSADEGGGVYNAGRLIIEATTVTGNSATTAGGVLNAGGLSLFRSDVSGNDQADDSADLIHLERGGASGGLRWSHAATLDADGFVATYAIDSTFHTLGIADWSSGASRLYVDGVFGDALTESHHLVIDPIGPPIGVPELPQDFVAGTLTAGSIDDQAAIEEFAEFLVETHARLAGQGRYQQAYPEIRIDEVAVIRIADESGAAIGDAKVEVFATDEDGYPVGEALLVTRTGGDGVALFSTGIDGAAASETYQVVVTPLGDGPAATAQFDLAAGGDPADWSVTVAGGVASAPQQLDLAIVIDTTGSMSDELEFIKVELDAILERVATDHPGVDTRLSLVAYRDEGDTYVSRAIDFTGDTQELRDQLAAQFASGGGDYPEAMHEALGDAARFSWRAEGTARVLFLVADAPPHARHADETLAAMGDLREQGVRVYPIAASGVADAAEYVMRTGAFLTGGEYLFLTDDSGFGLPHAEPDVDAYDVETLSQLMSRMIASELAGVPVEAEEVIRRVERSAAESLSLSLRAEPTALVEGPSATDLVAGVTDAALLLLLDGNLGERGEAAESGEEDEQAPGKSEGDGSDEVQTGLDALLATV